MKEFIEKLIGRLEESRKTALNKVKLPIMIVCKHDLQEFVDICFEESKNIVNQLAEEYNGGWIPCSERLPKIGTLVLATTESGNVCDDVLIYDYVCSTSKEPCFHMWDDEMWNCYTPRVIAWQPLPEPYQPRGE